MSTFKDFVVLSEEQFIELKSKTCQEAYYCKKQVPMRQKLNVIPIGVADMKKSARIYKIEHYKGSYPGMRIILN